MSESHKSTTRSFVVGATMGAAIGTALGLLYAPERGEKTRRKLKRNLEEGCKKAEEFSKVAREKAEEVGQQAVREFEVLRERVEDWEAESDSEPDEVVDESSTAEEKPRRRRPRRFRGV